MSEGAEPPNESTSRVSQALQLFQKIAAAPDDPDLWIPGLHKCMFSALRAECSSSAPVHPEVLCDAWEEVLHRAQTLKCAGYPALWKELCTIRNDVTNWLAAYTEATGQSAAEQLCFLDVNASYIHACRACLSGEGETIKVPFAVVTTCPSNVGHVLWLHLQFFPGQNSDLFCHPEFAHDAEVFESLFTLSLHNSFRLAMKTDTARHGIIFWKVVADNGQPLERIVHSVEGNSASGAAYRAFWHIAHNKLIDEDVYILGAVTDSEDSVLAVGGLPAKIKAIIERSSGGFPPLIVVPANCNSEESQAVDEARTWAEVRTVEKLGHLREIRSCAVMAALGHLNRLVDHLNPSLEWRESGDIKLEDVYQSGQCMITTNEPQMHNDSGENRESNREKKKTTEVRTIEEACLNSERTSPILLVGEPGSGKSTALLRVARELAIRGRTQIEQRGVSLLSVDWPFLCDFATWMSQTDDPITSIEKATSSRNPPPNGIQPSHIHRRKALARLHSLRLHSNQRATWILLDAYDQRSEAHSKELLANRLNQLLAFYPRLVISSRPGEQNSPPIQGLQLAKIKPLSPRDSVMLASHWLDTGQAQALINELEQRNMSHALENPLLLTATAQLASGPSDFELPATTCQLYQRLIVNLTVRGLAIHNPPTSVSQIPASLVEILERTAWMLFAKNPGENTFSVHDFCWSIGKCGLAPVNEIQANEYLDLFAKCRFIERIGQNAIQFHHTTYIEFLAASRLIKVVEREGWNSECLPVWCEDGSWRNFSPAQTIRIFVNYKRWQPIYLWIAGHSWNPASFLALLIPTDKNPFCSLIKKVQPFFANYRTYERPRARNYQKWQKWLPVFRCYAEIDPKQDCEVLAEMIRPGIAVIMDCENDWDKTIPEESLSWKGKLWKKPQCALILCAELLRREGRWLDALGVVRHRRIEYEDYHSWIEVAYQGFSVSEITPSENLCLEFLGMPKDCLYSEPERISLYHFRGALAAHLVSLAKKRCSTSLLQQIEHCIESAHRSTTDECHVLAALLKSHNTCVANRALVRIEAIFTACGWAEPIVAFGRLCSIGFSSEIHTAFLSFIRRIIEEIIPIKYESVWQVMDTQCDFIMGMLEAVKWDDIPDRQGLVKLFVEYIKPAIFMHSASFIIEKFIRKYGAEQDYKVLIEAMTQSLVEYPGGQISFYHLDHLTRLGVISAEGRRYYYRLVRQCDFISNPYSVLTALSRLEEEFGIRQADKIKFLNKLVTVALADRSDYRYAKILLRSLNLTQDSFDKHDKLRMAFRVRVLNGLCDFTYDLLNRLEKNWCGEHYDTDDILLEVLPVVYECERWQSLLNNIKLKILSPFCDCNFFISSDILSVSTILIKAYAQSTKSKQLILDIQGLIKRRRHFILLPIPVLGLLRKLKIIELHGWPDFHINWYPKITNEINNMNVIIDAFYKELIHRGWNFRHNMSSLIVIKEGDTEARRQFEFTDDRANG